MPVRTIQELAKRMHQRRRDFEERHPGMRVPIGDTLSHILQHDPDYHARRRVAIQERPLIQNPGIFTVQRIADALETTVGDLLDENEFSLGPGERYELRRAAMVIGRLAKLKDE